MGAAASMARPRSMTVAQHYVLLGGALDAPVEITK